MSATDIGCDVDELIAAGHQVVGLARSDSSAVSLEAMGAAVRRGDLDDLDAIRGGAADADAVVHLANKRDWSDPAASNRAERAAVEALVATVEGSDRRLLIASGTAGLTRGRLATETDRTPFRGPDARRGGSENLVLDAAERGVNAVSVRFAPTVHGAGDHGFVASLVAVAEERGLSGHPGDGSNRWPAVHRSDAARAVVLGLERASGGDVLHVVAEEGVPTRVIAEAIGRVHGLPVASVPTERAADHFGWIGGFLGLDMAASSEATRRLLGWTPTGPTLLEDLDAGAYGPGR